MDDGIKQEMMTYYNERAEEYDEIYTGGYGGKRRVTLEPGVYQKDVGKIAGMISDFGKGHLIDIACGTGFWLQYYAGNCYRITLLDQSEKMLKECTRRVEKLGLVDLVTIIQGDLFEVKLETSTYDSALIGFLLSHLTLEQEETFFLKLKRILKPSSQLVFIDSAWNDERRKYRKKEGIQERVLNDGRTFNVYKRYFNKTDIEVMFSNYNFEISDSHVGKAIVSAILRTKTAKGY
ncbi:MAG: class I SAM-dependent methyltransferase [Candidatus Odinarchaeota archaeon]